MNWKLLLTLLAVQMLVACIPATAVTPTIPVPPTAITKVPTPPGGDIVFLPNPTLTPGALNSEVTQETIQTTICVPGYSSSIRPPVSYTDALKAKELADPAYGDTADQDPAHYELDHFIPLSIGGNPTDQKNLWPQPRLTTPYNAGVKDTLEYTLYKEVCAGSLTLDTAQQAITSDWVQAYRVYVSPILGVLPNFNLTPEP